MKGLVVFSIVSVLAVTWYVKATDDENRAFILQLAKYAATERPSLDQMCATYFEWSTKYNDRVAGMEEHCAKPFIKHTSTP